MGFIISNSNSYDSNDKASIIVAYNVTINGKPTKKSLGSVARMTKAEFHALTEPERNEYIHTAIINNLAKAKSILQQYYDGTLDPRLSFTNIASADYQKERDRRLRIITKAVDKLSWDDFDFSQLLPDE